MKHKIKKKDRDYEKEVFIFTLSEGGDFKDIKYKHFSDATITGDITLGKGKGKEITFFAEIVGFHDSIAPLRNWGMGIKGYMRRCFKKGKPW